MDYINKQRVNLHYSIPVFIMEKHQTGQEEKLIKVIAMADNSEAANQPRCSTAGHSGCFKCVVTLATVMGLIIVAMMAIFILHFFRFMPSHNQDAPSAKVLTLCNLTESEKGIYDIFTAEKAATYLIFGWVQFLKVPNEELTLMQRIKGGDSRSLEKKKASQTEIFFCNKVKMVPNAIISMSFQSHYLPTCNSRVIVCELGTC